MSKTRRKRRDLFKNEETSDKKGVNKIPKGFKKEMRKKERLKGKKLLREYEKEEDEEEVLGQIKNIWGRPGFDRRDSD